MVRINSQYMDRWPKENTALRLCVSAVIIAKKEFSRKDAKE